MGHRVVGVGGEAKAGKLVWGPLVKREETGRDREEQESDW